MSTAGHRSFRPTYHYTPPKGWINDPNGLTFADGVWHLFAQHYPHDTVWGPMHWIHATSVDLLNWEDKGIALFPDAKLGQIFSGSAVIDRGNTSGLGTGCDPMICMYTNHGTYEQQSIAFSNDRVHFTPYEGNPVIQNLVQRDFRDPKIFRNEILDCWSVVIAAGDHVEFYASDDLIHWTKTGEFGALENLLGGIFECPDLFPLTAPDGTVTWILIASMALPREFGGSRTQYFIGQFDGNTFMQAYSEPRIRLIDSGYDNYATVSFFGAEPPTVLGWANSWCYADKEPTGEFCGLMTFARRLSLAQTESGLCLASRPIVPEFYLKEVEGIAGNHAFVPLHPTAKGVGDAFHIHIEAEGSFKLSLSNPQGETFRISLDNEHRFVIDRTEAGFRDFHDQYRSGLMSVMVTPRQMRGNVIMDIYFDRCISEIFADEGTFVNTTLVFPEEPYSHAEIIGPARMWIGYPAS